MGDAKRAGRSEDGARQDTASAAWAAARDVARRQRELGPRPNDAGPSQPWQPEEWIDEGAVRDEAEEAVGRGRKRRSSPAAAADPEGGGTDGLSPAPWDPTWDQGELAEALDEAQGARGPDVDAEIAEVRKAVGGARAPRFERQLRDASAAFRRGRYDEARRLVRPLAESAPQMATVRELYGLTLYRLGRWKAAARELEGFRTLTGSVEQHPVLADCYRALRRYADVEDLWRELSAASPSAALVAEGRIVAAGALADQGRVGEAIRLLQPGVRPIRKAKEHHLRVAYVLADLYERAGELPQARELFQRIASADPTFVDVEARLRALR